MNQLFTLAVLLGGHGSMPLQSTSLLFADDDVLLATFQVALQHAPEHFTEECETGPRP